MFPERRLSSISNGILRLIELMKVDATLAFVAASIPVDLAQTSHSVARLGKIDWDALGSHDWFRYNYKTGKLYRVSGLVLMIRKFTDGTEVKIERTEVIRPIYREEFATRGLSFKIAKAALFQ